MGILTSIVCEFVFISFHFRWSFSDLVPILINFICIELCPGGQVLVWGSAEHTSMKGSSSFPRCEPGACILASDPRQRTVSSKPVARAVVWPLHRISEMGLVLTAFIDGPFTEVLLWAMH